MRNHGFIFYKREKTGVKVEIGVKIKIKILKMNKLKNNLKWGDKRINGCEDRE